MQRIMPFMVLLICIVDAAAASAQAPIQIPPNTIACRGFQKQPDGSWYALPNNQPFDVGNAHQITLQDKKFGPRERNLGGYDLALVLDAICGS